MLLLVYDEQIAKNVMTNVFDRTDMHVNGRM